MNLEFLKENLIAHRGLHNNIDIPENSLKAFSLAIKNNYIIELDVHLLKDNTVIVFHDDNLKRMTGIDKKIIDFTYDGLKNINLLNTNYKIPKLDEVLKLVNGKVPIIIELKYDRKVGVLERQLVKLLDNYNGLFCIKSFNPFIVRWFKKNRKNYIRGLLVPYKTNNLKELILKKMYLKKICSPHFLSCNYKLYNDKKVMKYRKKIPVLFWTIKNKSNYLKYKNKCDNLICENIDTFKI